MVKSLYPINTSLVGFQIAVIEKHQSNLLEILWNLPMSHLIAWWMEALS